MYPQTKTMTLTHTETLSTDTDRTVIDTTKTVHTAAMAKNGSYGQLLTSGLLPQTRPEPRLSPMLSALPVTGLQQVQQWVATPQASAAPCQTPPVSVIQTISRTQTDVSTIPLGYSASHVRSHHPSQSTIHSRRSRRSSKSTVVDALANFGSQMTGNLMSFADKCSQDAARREESMGKKAMRREELVREEAVKREELARQGALAMRQEAVERETLALAREQNAG